MHLQCNDSGEVDLTDALPSRPLWCWPGECPNHVKRLGCPPHKAMPLPKQWEDSCLTREQFVKPASQPGGRLAIEILDAWNAHLPKSHKASDSALRISMN
jgi:hypothetical protein